MGVPMTLDTSTSGHHAVFNTYRSGGGLSHYMHAVSSFFGNLLTARRVATPVGKRLAERMAEEAVTTDLPTKDPLGG